MPDHTLGPVAENHAIFSDLPEGVAGRYDARVHTESGGSPVSPTSGNKRCRGSWNGVVATLHIPQTVTGGPPAVSRRRKIFSSHGLVSSRSKITR